MMLTSILITLKLKSTFVMIAMVTLGSIFIVVIIVVIIIVNMTKNKMYKAQFQVSMDTIMLTHK